MKTRYVLDASTGLLTSRNGETLGRVVSITIDDAPDVGRGLGRSTSLRDGEPLAGQREDRLPPSPEREVGRIWSYYVEVIPSNRRLDDKRKRIILNALHVMCQTHGCTLEKAEALVKRAVLGLSRSPHHNGDNEQRRTYLEIRYALKGIGNESDDERIEKAITWAAIYGERRNGTDPAKVERWLDEVRYHLGKRAIDPGATAGRDRAIEAYRKLAAAGYKLERLGRPPYVRVAQ